MNSADRKYVRKSYGQTVYKCNVCLWRHDDLQSWRDGKVVTLHVGLSGKFP